MKDMTIPELKQKAVDYKKKMLTLAHVSGGMHVGGDLSMADILVALYYRIMKIDAARPDWAERDYFILSKGHGAGGLYTILADMGFFDMEHLLTTYNKLDSCYGMHPDRKKAPGVEVSAGSLGHGLSITNGMAYASKMDGEPNRYYCLMGDGEIQEGSVWEAAMSAAHFHLDNVIAIIDRNGLSLDGYTEDVMALEPLEKKWEAFGWNAIRVNGHDMEAIIKVFENLKPNGKPTCIIAETIKGCGIDFMENDPNWHAGTVDSEMLKKCCDLLDTCK